MGERELIHLQQQQVFFNERQVQKQKDLINNDQTYIQREYMDAKDKFENDRYVLIDKINHLEIENNKYQITEQSLTKQLNLKTEMCMFLEEQLDAYKKSLHQKEQEVSKYKQEEFISRQTIKNLQNEQIILSKKLQKLQADEEESSKKHIASIKVLEMEKMKLQNENSILLSGYNQMKDELEIYRAQKAMISNKKKKKKKCKESSKKSKEKAKTKLSKIKKTSSKARLGANKDKKVKAKSSSKL